MLIKQSSEQDVSEPGAVATGCIIYPVATAPGSDDRPWRRWLHYLFKEHQRVVIQLMSVAIALPKLPTSLPGSKLSNYATEERGDYRHR